MKLKITGGFINQYGHTDTILTMDIHGKAKVEGGTSVTIGLKLWKDENSKQEAEAMIQLFDIATKTSGLKVAETAIFLTKKLEDAFREEAKKAEKEKEEEPKPKKK